LTGTWAASCADRACDCGWSSK
jgi:hypothetical protein